MRRGRRVKRVRKSGGGVLPALLLLCVAFAAGRLTQGMGEARPTDEPEAPVLAPEAQSEPEPAEDAVPEGITIVFHRWVEAESEPEAETETEPEAPAEEETAPGLEGLDASRMELKNETALNIDLADYLARTPDVELSETEPSVLIIHTHASEAYTPTAANSYEPSDPDRTEDTRYNVVRVGEAIEAVLTRAGVKVVHDTELYDYPSYNGSYSRTLEAVEKYLEQYPTIEVVLDVHRDSVQNADGVQLGPTAEIDGQSCARVMLVVGTGEGGLYHPDWGSNLALAVRLQAVMDREFPGLSRPLNLRSERFNQHTTGGSLIVEVGCAGNTLEEALPAAEKFAECAAAVLTARN